MKKEEKLPSSKEIMEMIEEQYKESQKIYAEFNKQLPKIEERHAKLTSENAELKKVNAELQQNIQTLEQEMTFLVKKSPEPKAIFDGKDIDAKLFSSAKKKPIKDFTLPSKKKIENPVSKNLMDYIRKYLLVEIETLANKQIVKGIKLL